MRNFFLKVFALLLPMVLALGYVEYRLSKMPNSYDIKKALLEKNLSEIEILVTGSSNAYFGIDPEYFDLKGFNAAYRAQSHWYDTQITLKYLDRMPKLKVVIIPVIYLTFGTESEDLADKWRVFFYEQSFGIHPPPISLRESYDSLFWIDPKRFSRIALYGERTPDYVLKRFQENIGEDVEPNGWFDAGVKPMDMSLRIGPNGGPAHNALVKTQRYPENLLYIQQLVDELKRRGVVPVLLQLPAHKEISKYWDQAKLSQMDKALQTFAAKNNIRNLNYRNDPRFNAADFTDMPDHLNKTGAKKISLIINHDIVRPLAAFK